MSVSKFLKAVVERRNILLTGGAGTGKSYTINMLKKHDTTTPTKYLATTGIATNQVDGECETIHSFFKLFPQLNVSNFHKYKHFLSNELRQYKRLVIDEVSMLRADTFELIDLIARHTTHVDKPMGGVQVIFVGDFFQLPPVARAEEGLDRVWAFHSKIWHEYNFEYVNLTKIYRTKDIEFVKTLNNIRRGVLTHEDLKLIKLRENINLQVTQPITLVGTNKEVDEINTRELEKLKGEKVELISPVIVNEIFNNQKERQAIYAKFLKDEITPEKIELKIGARVLVTKNQPTRDDNRASILNRYVNGTVGKVIEIYDIGTNGYIRILDDFGREYVIKRHVIGVERDDYDYSTARSDYEEYKVNFRLPYDISFESGKKLTYDQFMLRKKYKVYMFQYPIKLCYALTVHKSQGMSLDFAEIDFKKINREGQAYVALSRMKTLEGLRVKNFNPQCVVADYQAKQFYKYSVDGL